MYGLYGNNNSAIQFIFSKFVQSKSKVSEKLLIDIFIAEFFYDKKLHWPSQYMKEQLKVVYLCELLFEEISNSFLYLNY